MKKHFQDKEKFEQTLSNKVKKTVSLLEEEWLQLGISEEQKVKRELAIYEGISNLCDKILDDERNMKERTLKRIENNKMLLFQLTEELNLTYTEPNDLPLLDIDTFLEDKIAELQGEKEKRMADLRRLLEEHENLCKYLGVSPHYLPKNLLPVEDDLVLLRNHIHEKKEEKNLRIATYRRLREEILKFIEQLEKLLEDELTVNVVCNEDPNTLTSSFLLDVRKLHSDLEFEAKELKSQSLELREKISSLWNLFNIAHDTKEAFLATVPSHTPSCVQKLRNQLSEMKELRLQNMGRFIEELRTQLEKWWDRCYVGDGQKATFTTINSTDVTEEILDAYEAEVSQWKKYYDENSNILEKVDNFLALFDSMQQLKAKLKDPSRLFNSRGGVLLQEEKERKRVKQALPQVQTQLIDLCSEYEAANDQPFLIDGCSVQEYLTKLWDYHDIQNEKEKCDRNKKKLQPVSKPRVGKGASPWSGKGDVAATHSAPRKRARDENENEDRLAKCRRAARGGMAACSSAAQFRSHVKGLEPSDQGPAFAPRNTKPLFERNRLAPLTQPLRSDDDALHNSVSYDNFKETLRNKDEYVNSTSFECDDETL